MTRTANSATPELFIQLGEGIKRPYRACLRVGMTDWIVLGCYSTKEKAEARLEKQSKIRT